MSYLAVGLIIFVGGASMLSALGKLAGVEQIHDILDHVGVSGPLRAALPFLQIAGGAGALLGLIAFPRVGVAALVGLALYYAGAVVFHRRVGDGPDAFGVPAGLAVVAALAALVRALTL